MPELPDIVVYLAALQSRIVGERLERLGKRIIFGLDDDYFVILHLMIAGRLRRKQPGAPIPKPLGLAAFGFPAGTVPLTEAGRKHRASLYLARGAAGLA